MSKQVIHTDKAPAAIGTYSQAIKVGDTVYLSGQIPLNPTSMELVDASKPRWSRCSRISSPSPKPPVVPWPTSSS